MLTIQPSISRINNSPAFKGENDKVLVKDPVTGDYMTVEELKALRKARRQARAQEESANLPVEYRTGNTDKYLQIKEKLAREETEYNEEADFWQEQKQTFDDLSKDNDVPGILKKPMKFFSVVISGILGGMAMVWGSKKSIGAMESLAETQKVKGFRNATKTKFKSFKTAVSNAFNSFKKSEFMTNMKASHNKRVAKFNNSKFGKSKFVKGISNTFKSVKKKVSNGYKTIKTKVKGIKGEQIKNATVNTLGVSGGVTSGVTAAKEFDKADKDAE